MAFNLKISEETIKAPLVGTEMIRLATTGANWRTTLADLFLAALPQPVILGGHAANSKITLRSTDIASGATTDAIELQVGNAGQFHGLYVGHVGQALSPTVQTLMVLIGADGSYGVSTPAKLNVIGGGHWDVGGAVILCETADTAHSSVQFTSLAPNVWPGGAGTVDDAPNYKTYNVGINGPDWGSDLSGALFLFDHDHFVHRALFFPDGSATIGNDAGANPGILINAATAPDKPLVIVPGLLVAEQGLGIGTEEIGVVLVAASSGIWTLTFPSGPGSAGQKLTTNGSGVCSWT
jgi:hypothetical protein